MSDLARGVAQGAQYLHSRLRKVLGLQDEYRGGVLNGLQPVIVSEDATDHRFIWGKRGYSWEQGDITPSNGLLIPTILLRARIPIVTQGVYRLIRIRSLRLWSLGVSGQVGWRILNGNFQPALTSADVSSPIPNDGRQGTTANSLLELVSGLNADGPVTGGLDDWARAGITAQAIQFDPRITLRYGDAFQIASATEAGTFGASIQWEEHPCTRQEWIGDVQDAATA